MSVTSHSDGVPFTLPDVRCAGGSRLPTSASRRPRRPARETGNLARMSEIYMDALPDPARVAGPNRSPLSCAVLPPTRGSCPAWVHRSVAPAFDSHPSWSRRYIHTAGRADVGPSTLSRRDSSRAGHRYSHTGRGAVIRGRTDGRWSLRCAVSTACRPQIQSYSPRDCMTVSAGDVGFVTPRRGGRVRLRSQMA